MELSRKYETLEELYEHAESIETRGVLYNQEFRRGPEQAGQIFKVREADVLCETCGEKELTVESMLQRQICCLING